jgi:murein L,D-transpeptidase YcbB/YkuD
MTNDYDGTTPANAYLFDSALDRATRGFQARHGLLVNGIIDEATRRVMNVSLEDRIQQLSIAMERWRWLPRSLGDEYVWVNAAEAKLNIIIDGKSVLSMRTIVGHSTRPTPSLQSEIRRVVFNPTWSVPYSIATEDLLPKLRNDHSFLTRNGFRVYTGSSNNTREVNPTDVDWSDISPNSFPYRFIQQSGPGNSLGRIKFVFDNPHNIYIHDTPSKGLFGLRTRTFSSGCVRLEQADEFANALLAADRDWSDTDTQRYLDDDHTQGINLQRKIPIYVVYITSWVTEDGQAHFRRDLYHRDAAVGDASIAHRQLPINHPHQF